MKKILRLISVICAVALLGGCGLVTDVEKKEETKKSEIVATVDEVDYNVERFNLHFYSAQDEILKEAGYQDASAIPKDFWEQKVDGKTNLERAKEKALQTLIEDALAYKNALSNGIEITSEEKSAIANQMSYLKQDKASLAQFDQIGIGEEELENYYTEMFHMQHLIPKLIEKGDIKVDEKEVLAALNETYVKAKHILISTVDTATQQPLPDAEVAAAEKKAQQILNKINAGEDFDTLMNAESQDPGLASAPDGYVFTTGEMIAEFEEAAFSLAEEQVSGLVYTSYGIHIIKRVALDLEGAEEAAAIEAVENQLAMPEYEKLLKTWKSKADIKTYDKVLDKIKPTITNSKE